MKCVGWTLVPEKGVEAILRPVLGNLEVFSLENKKANHAWLALVLYLTDLT